MKLVGTITLDNFVMGERYTLCTSPHLSPEGGGVPRGFRVESHGFYGERSGYQSSLTQYKVFNLKTIEKL